jgi:hypothetical protein
MGLRGENWEYRSEIKTQHDLRITKGQIAGKAMPSGINENESRKLFRGALCIFDSLLIPSRMRKAYPLCENWLHVDWPALALSCSTDIPRHTTLF